jgi:hypothetical protein
MIYSSGDVIRLCWFLLFFLPFVQSQFGGNGLIDATLDELRGQGLPFPFNPDGSNPNRFSNVRVSTCMISTETKITNYLRSQRERTDLEDRKGNVVGLQRKILKTSQSDQLQKQHNHLRLFELQFLSLRQRALQVLYEPLFLARSPRLVLSLLLYSLLHLLELRFLHR